MALMHNNIFGKSAVDISEDQDSATKLSCGYSILSD